MQFHSLKYRIALTIFILGVLLIAIVLWSTLSFFRDATYKQFANSEEAVLSLLSGVSRMALLTEEYSEVQPYFEKVKEIDHAHIVRILLSDDQNRIVASSNPADVGPSRPRLVDSADQVWVTQKIDNPAGLLGELAIQYSQQPLQEIFRKAGNRGIITGVVGMAVIGLVSIGLGFALTRRLEQLSHMVTEVTKGNWTLKSPVTGQDEVAKLGMAFHVMTDKLRQTLDDLQYNEKRLGGILDNAEEGIISVDDLQIIQLFNKGAENIFGYQAEEIIGQPLTTLMPQRVHEAHSHYIVNFAHAPQETRQMGERREVVGRRKNGEEFPAEASISKLTLQGRTIFTAILRDVSARKQREQSLRESEERYQDLYDNAPAMFASVDAATGKVLQCNHTLASATGYLKEEIVGRPILDMYHPDSLEDARQAFYTFVSIGEVKDAELQLRRRDASKIDVLLNVSSILDAQGRIIQSRSVWRDITARKQAEAALRMSEERYRMLVEHSPFCIHLLHSNATIVSMNHAGLHMLGLQKESEVCGILFLDLVSDVDRVRVRDLFDHALEGASAEFEFLSANGKIFQSSFIPIGLGEDETVTTVMGISQDITERKATEEKINAVNVQLRELAHQLRFSQEEERKRIARELHDEFGQALTALNFDLSLVRKQLSQERNLLQKEEIFSKLGFMSRSVVGIIYTVRKIASSLRPSILDDLGLVEALEWELREFQKRTGIPCQVKIAPGVQSQAIADSIATALFRISQEFLTNVVRYAHASQVQVSLHEEAQTICLDMMDNGKGITDEHINNPYSLGIVGMKERVFELAGEFRISGCPGVGTKVMIRIPCTSSRNRKG